MSDTRSSGECGASALRIGVTRRDAAMPHGGADRMCVACVKSFQSAPGARVPEKNPAAESSAYERINTLGSNGHIDYDLSIAALANQMTTTTLCIKLSFRN